MPRSREITDPDVRLLAGLAATLEADYGDDSLDWEGSPFAWIKSRPSRQVGAIGERLVAGWLAARDFAVGPAGDNEADRIVNNKRVEVKFSTLWAGGHYKFQQIRNQRYDLMICLGVSPFDTHSWVFTKDFLLDGWGNLQGFSPQHGGRAGIDTAWIQVDPAAPQPWIIPHGGTLRDSINTLAQLLSR